MPNLILFLLTVQISVCISLRVHAQSEPIRYKSPNTNLSDIVTSSYKGLQRLGQQDAKGMNSYKTNDKMTSQQKLAIKNELDDIWFNQNKLFQLLYMQHLEVVFNHIDTSRLTPSLRGYAGTETEKKIKMSWYGQKFMAHMANQFVTDAAYPKYFCPKNAPCKIERDKPSWSWAWPGANEFDRFDSYRGFMSQNYADMRKWARQISNEAYLVNAVTLETYDFEKEGFPLKIRPNDQVYTFRHILQPKEKFEKGFDKPGERPVFKTLLPMSPENGKALRERQQSLFLVFHIEFTGVARADEILDGKGFDIPTMLFHLKSPLVEVFENESLTQKLCDITIDFPR